MVSIAKATTHARMHAAADAAAAEAAACHAARMPVFKAAACHAASMPVLEQQHAMQQQCWLLLLMMLLATGAAGCSQQQPASSSSSSSSMHPGSWMPVRSYMHASRCLCVRACGVRTVKNPRSIQCSKSLAGQMHMS
jgi:hypothetical protein